MAMNLKPSQLDVITTVLDREPVGGGLLNPRHERLAAFLSRLNPEHGWETEP